jgi:hypothetical protein
MSGELMIPSPCLHQPDRPTSPPRMPISGAAHSADTVGFVQYHYQLSGATSRND